MDNVKATNRKQSFGTHALVIGGSIAGLTAARVLADYYGQVTVVERDNWADSADFRKGVPQARHSHVLLKRGELIFEELFPGIGQELVSRGAVKFNLGQEMAWFTFGNWRPRYDSSVVTLACSRPLIETALRYRLAEFSNIKFKSGWEVTGLQAVPWQTRAYAVTARSRDENQLEDIFPADFIVDASGRSSRAPEWLETVGIQLPEELMIDAFPGYSTRIYKRPAEFKPNWTALYIQPMPPNSRRGAIITPLEGDRWHATIIGMNRDYPPTDEAGYLEFAQTLPTLEFYEAIKNAKPLSPVVGFRSGSNRLRHYDRLNSYLDNFVVLGDAVYSFNPVYGQGMTVAAMSALELGKILQERRDFNLGLAGLAENFQKRLNEVISPPWQIATGEDMRWPETTGVVEDTDPAGIMMQTYMEQVVYTTTKNPVVTEAFYRVMNMLDAPTNFFRPDIVLHVATEMRQGMTSTESFPLR